MAGEYVLWFDARCSACQRALTLLRRRGIDPLLRRYLEEPPSLEELRALLVQLGIQPHAVVRPEEEEYQALCLSERTPEPALLGAILAHPRILARPILVRGGRAVIVRSPERALELLNSSVPPSCGPPGPDRQFPLPPGAEEDPAGPFGEPFPLPIDGILDLHAFRPGEVGRLIPEWISACAAAGLTELRIVHGKGTGSLRRTVHSLLARDPGVLSFRLAGEDGGGWGATLVALRPGVGQRRA